VAVAVQAGKQPRRPPQLLEARLKRHQRRLSEAREAREALTRAEARLLRSA
jgi:hypothetical protein